MGLYFIGYQSENILFGFETLFYIIKSFFSEDVIVIYRKLKIN